MRKYLNESLPVNQRLGQVGMSNKYGEMKIVAYRNAIDMDIYFKDYNQVIKNRQYRNFLLGSISLNHKQLREGFMNTSTYGEEMMIYNYRTTTDVDIIFLHNWEVVNTTYYCFLEGCVENPLYNKEHYEGQVRMNLQGKWMILKEWIESKIFIVEFEDGVRVKSQWKYFNKGNVTHPKDKKTPENHKIEREGNINLSIKNEEMMILNYKNSRKIDVIFLNNWSKVRTSYVAFLKGEVKNPLYYKDKYEGQIRKNNQGYWMRLLIWNNAENCVVEFEDGTLVDCRYRHFDEGGVANPNYIKPSDNEFYFNNDLNCWVGITNKGEEFLFSHPDKKVIEHIKSCTWHINRNGYVVNSKKEQLHHIIKPIPQELKDKYDRIDHIDNNKLDNRYENLRYSNAKLNNKNKRSIGKSGITGLKEDKSNKWYGCCKKICTKHYKDKQEALIDLLILQRMFKATHNEHLWYLIDNVSQERINYVEEYIKEKIEKRKDNKHTVTCHNTFEKVDKYTYKMYDSKGNWCLIDAEDLEKVKMGSWNCTIYYTCRNKKKNKKYFGGDILINNERKTVQFHRFILNLIGDYKYRKYIVDHLSGEETNNRKENLIITDHRGNMMNISDKKGYVVDKRNDKFEGRINLSNKNICRRFDTKQEAMSFYNHYKKILIDNRIQWKSKEELDKWIEHVENSGLTIDKAIEEHYDKLYSYVRELIEKEYPSKANKKSKRI